MKNSTSIKKQPWFYMPNSAHKKLVLGDDIVSGAILPIGQLPEETQEYRNKDPKYSGDVIRGKHLGH